MDKNNTLNDLNKGNESVVVGRGYSNFVKLMRWGLPLLAIALVFVVVGWPKMEDKLVIVPKEEIVQKPQNEIGENELLNPKFETTDSNQNPVSVTALRALQNQENPNLVKLDQPNADLKMRNGKQVLVSALNGTYEQETEKLYLNNNVVIKHESGYALSAEELRLNMKTREAFSDKNVMISGPDVDIKAVGLEGEMGAGRLLFKGPIQMTIKPNKTLKTGSQNAL